jgi:hypothetical protein
MSLQQCLCPLWCWRVEVLYQRCLLMLVLVQPVLKARQRQQLGPLVPNLLQQVQSVQICLL